jgi:hypothetical protein
MPLNEVVIRGDKATVEMPDGRSLTLGVEEMFSRAAQRQIDSCGIRLPREVCFAYSRGDFVILACEYPPGPYPLSWIAEDSPAPYGSSATYRQVTLSLPYVIVLAAFEGSLLSSVNECFFRNAPLTEVDEESELCFPALLNCSHFVPPEGKPLSWICTQNADRRPIAREKDSRKRIAVGLNVLRHCLFEQSFNMSSDYHEFSSWYSESRGIDDRISTATRWHEETIKDRYMGLDVAWLPANETLKSVVERMFQNQGLTKDGICHARQLARVIVNNAKKGSEKR